MRLRPVRHLAVVAIAALLAACGTAPSQPLGTPVAPADVQAEGFDLEGAIESALYDAELGDVKEAHEKLRMLQRSFRLQKSSDFKEYVMITRAQRKLVDLTPDDTDTWLALAVGLSNEVKRSYEIVSKTMRMWDAAKRRPNPPEVAFADVMVLVNEAHEAMLDRFPALSPAMAAKMPSFGKRDGDWYPYLMYGVVLTDEAAAATVTNDDVYALQEAVDAVVDRAVANPEVPREIIVQLSRWSTRYDNLEPGQYRRKIK